MFYQVRHVTSYRYSEPIRESQMELRMQPRSEGPQRCWQFRVTTNPASEVSSYLDPRGNHVHHFDIPGRHQRLSITVESIVEVDDLRTLPDSLPPSSWDELEGLADGPEGCEMLLASTFSKPTEALEAFLREHRIARGPDPLTTLRSLNRAVYEAFQYTPRHTRVDSPIDEALASRKGVCQDFAHIAIAAARHLGIPARYVSGYLFHRKEDHDRSQDDATHAWFEALLPDLGWVGFDPTNHLEAGPRHIRTAIGRDYADVPPTRGVFKGQARTETELNVAVRVGTADAPPPLEAAPVVTTVSVSQPFEVRQQQGQQQQ